VLVIAGHSRPKDGVASARLCPAIHHLRQESFTSLMDARVKPGHDGGRLAERLEKRQHSVQTAFCKNPERILT
jgi:hypothetical protein